MAEVKVKGSNYKKIVITQSEKDSLMAISIGADKKGEHSGVAAFAYLRSIERLTKTLNTLGNPSAPSVIISPISPGKGKFTVYVGAKDIQLEVTKKTKTTTKPKKPKAAASSSSPSSTPEANSKAGSPESQSTGGKPSAGKQDDKYYWTTNPKTGKPMRKRKRTGSDYEDMDIVRSKSLGQLASERMMGGAGIGASLKGAMKDKIAAKGNAIKKAFDPMNMLSKLPGGLGTMAATAWGKKRGRDPKDISYFTGIHAPDKEPVPDKEETVTATKVGKKSGSGGGLGGGAVGILKEIKQTIIDKFEDDKKQKEIEKNFDEQKKAEEDKKHKELIDAIHGIHGGEKATPVKEQQKSGLLGMLGDLLGGFLGKGKGLLKGVGSVAKRIGKGVVSAGKSIVKGGKNLAVKAGRGVKGAFTGMKSALGFGGKSATVASKGLDASKAALTQAKPGTVVKVAEAAEKAGAAAAKGGKTAAKVAGAGSKLLKGGSKLLGFVKAIPGLSLITAGADLVMRLKEVNDKKASGEISDADYKKEITKAIGSAAAAGLLPLLGSAIGSIIPGVGTVVGGLAGAGAALMGGDKIGGWLAGKMYDYFVDDKKSGATASKAESKKPTASPVASTTSNPTKQAKGWESGPTSKQYIEDPNNPGKFVEVPKKESAKPVATPPKDLGKRVTQATATNMNLNSASTTKEKAPPVVNKNTHINSGGSSGGSAGGVRNDESVLQRIQYWNTRAV